MSLEDLLVNTGAEIARTTGEPWTPEYRRAQEAKKQAMDFARQREQRQQEAHNLKQQQTRMVMQDVERQWGRQDTEDKRKAYKDRVSELSTHSIGNWMKFSQDKDVNSLRQSIINNKKQYLDLYNDDPEKDANFENQVEYITGKATDKEIVEFAKGLYFAQDVAQKHLHSLEATSARKSGGSAFERSNLEAYQAGIITREKFLENKASFAGTKSGTETTKAQDATDARAQKKIMLKARANTKEDAEHFNHITRSLDTTIVALESGDTELNEQMAIQAMSQAVDSKVRAVKMYDIFDKSYGNIAGRTFESLQRFFAGSRSPEQKAVIIDTLKTFRNKYAKPGAQRIVNQARVQAIRDGQDPYDVAPPRDLADLRNEIKQGRLTKAEAMKLAKEYNFGVQ